jgi:hypothetical protein
MSKERLLKEPDNKDNKRRQQYRHLHQQIINMKHNLNWFSDSEVEMVRDRFGQDQIRMVQEAIANLIIIKKIIKVINNEMRNFIENMNDR